jgi:hypothetical protein
MIRPPNDWPDNHCADCTYFHTPSPPGPCNKHPGLTTDATSGACWDFQPHGALPPGLCPDCIRFFVFDNKLSCGAIPGAQAPAYLTACPMFAPKNTTSQPSGDDPHATQL